jgi:hypothetical protein
MLQSKSGLWRKCAQRNEAAYVMGRLSRLSFSGIADIWTSLRFAFLSALLVPGF